MRASGRRLIKLPKHGAGTRFFEKVDVNSGKFDGQTRKSAVAIVRSGLTPIQSFSRRYENDLDFRKQWATVTEAKQLMSLSKGMASLTPTSVGVGNTNVADDSAEAVRLIQEMAAKNGRAFETEFADPSNATLAARTYTGAHRSTARLRLHASRRTGQSSKQPSAVSSTHSGVRTEALARVSQ
jgi:hypothetical protein